jgi:hypothetical protein
MHVDDGDGNTTSPTMYSNFQTLIQKRYGPIDFHSPSRGTCGQAQLVNPDNSITLHYGPYITKMLNRIGVPPALSPDVEGLFNPSTDPTPLSPLATAEFCTTNGELIHLLPARHDILPKTTPSPTLLERYPFLGPTFSTNPADYPNGVEIHSSSDCAHNVHPTTG